VRSPAEIAAAYRTELTTTPSGLLGNWRFDEATGSQAPDATANHHDATVAGGATLTPAQKP
jgi:hypothetical protein